MSKDMLGMVPLSEAWGLVTDLVGKISGVDGREWVNQTKHFLRKEKVVWGGEAFPLFSSETNCYDLNIQSHYQFDECLKLPDGAKIKIKGMGDNFKAQILTNHEAAPRQGKLKSQILLRQSTDIPIIIELGELAVTNAAHLFELLCLQPNGEKGILLTSGGVNVFYIIGSDNAVWSVEVHCLSGGWEIAAVPIGITFGHTGRSKYSREESEQHLDPTVYDCGGFFIFTFKCNMIII